MNPEEFIKFLDELVYKKTGKRLQSLERAIIQGSLDSLTYKEIEKKDERAHNYDVGSIENVGCGLWKLLTEVLQDAKIINPDERVRKKSLWEFGMRIIPPQRPSYPRLRMRYRITEHLTSTELSDTYLAEDEDVPDRPLCAVKRLKSQSIETTEKFEHKAQILCKLGKHDRIPELLARFEEDGYFYLISKFIEGQPLSQELREGTPWE